MKDCGLSILLHFIHKVFEYLWTHTDRPQQIGITSHCTSPPKSAQVHNLQWGSRRRATVNLRKIGMTGRAFAFASLSPKPNLDANDSTCWRGKHMLGISWICRKCQRHPDAVKQSLTPRTHQRKKVKGTSSPHERDDEAMQWRREKEQKHTKTMANTGQPRQAWWQRKVRQQSQK
jgi:hypothetical protein